MLSTARETEMCLYSLGSYKCWRCNKTECSKRCAIFVVYIADLEIFYCRYFCWQLWGNEEGLIRTYLQRWELNINDSVRKYYNRSDYLTGSWSNSNNIITKNTFVIFNTRASIFDIVAPDSYSTLFYCYTHLQETSLLWDCFEIDLTCSSLFKDWFQLFWDWFNRLLFLSAGGL